MSGALLAAVGGDPLVEAPNVSASGNAASSSFASLTWDNDGTIDKTEDLSTTNDFDTWLTPQSGALASLYEIKFEQSGGDTLDVGSDSLSTWHSLGTARTLQLTQSGAGSKSANGTYIIRRAGAAELANGTWSLSVTAF